MFLMYLFLYLNMNCVFFNHIILYLYMLPILFLSSGFAVGFSTLCGFRSCPSQDVSVPGVGLKSLV